MHFLCVQSEKKHEQNNGNPLLSEILGISIDSGYLRSHYDCFL